MARNFVKKLFMGQLYEKIVSVHFEKNALRKIRLVQKNSQVYKEKVELHEFGQAHQGELVHFTSSLKLAINGMEISYNRGVSGTDWH